MNRKRIIAMTLVLCMLLPLVLAMPVFAQDKIRVVLNGKELNFDVDPILLNDRTMVPMRAIFEALGAAVYWNNDSDTAMGVKNGKRVTVTIDDVNATVDGKLCVLDQAAVLKNDRTLVPLRFVSEAFGSTVEWDDVTQTVNITSDSLPEGYFIAANAFSDLGCWIMNDDYLQGRTTAVEKKDAAEGEAEDAVYTLNVLQSGKYTVWVNSRDIPNNQPGTRYFHVLVDGELIEQKMGAHNNDGFYWVNVGTFNFEAGSHTFALQDTSGFYARTKGIFVCADASYQPSTDITELQKDYPAVDSFSALPASNFPAWAKKDMAETDTAVLENNHVKIVFYKGSGAKGAVVQNEIFIKVNGKWVQTKARAEELGFLMMAADESAYISSPGEYNDAGPTLISQTVTSDGVTAQGTITDFYKSGVPYWFIPQDFEQISDSEIRLTFPVKGETTLTATYALDSFSEDPKVTLNAQFGKSGSYAFLLFNGDGVTEYDTVTAPMLYVKKAIPETAIMISEVYMYTPMATFTVTKDGQKFTRGIAIDPSEAHQDFASPENSRYCAVLRTPDGKARGQFAAPQPGCGNSAFQAGDSYSISYRIIERAEDWYDTYTYVAQELYNDKDIRENYYTSINEAIYNATDLMLDDYHGGWDTKEMAWYNMEAPQVSSQANVMSVVQRYLLTESEEMLERRVVPTLAFALTRKSTHFSRSDAINGYTQGVSTLENSPTLYNTAVYEGLYEMSQGRMPYLLNAATEKAGKSANYTGITGQNALYNASGVDAFLTAVTELVDNFYKETLNPESDYMNNQRITGGFVFSDYTYLVASFLAAYEITREQKYLDAAEKASQLLVTATWTTGYENGFDSNSYTIDPEKTENIYLPYADKVKAGWFWHGKTQWRPGFEKDTCGFIYDSPKKLSEETVPGWVPAKTGLGTEHTLTASLTRVIYMNTWASLLMRLGAYTDDAFFTTQARNAMVGRFGNYAGYYQDRYITHQQKADYPYTGPDYTLVYWHHLPVFVSMLEDYLISAVMATSDMKITFPTLYQSGYAYFITGQYGHKPGTFYDEKDMWLWLDRGVVEPDSINADYIAARKDGKLAAAFINEKNEPLTTTVTLGQKVPGGSTYTGAATLYDENGSKSQVQVTNGVFTLTIPARGIRSVVLEIPGVTKPAYALDTLIYSVNNENTVASHTGGKAYAIQMNDQSYYAYVYVTDKDLKDMTVTYETSGGVSGEVTVSDGYPFETIIKVDDPSAEFEYSVTVTNSNGEQKSKGGGKLIPLTGGPKTTDVSTLEPAKPAEWGNTEVVKTIATGMGVGEGTIRIVVPVADFPFAVKPDNLVGCKVMATLVDKTTQKEMVLETEIVSNELRYSSVVLSVKPTDAVPQMDYGLSHTGYVHVYPTDVTEMTKPDPVEMSKPVELVNENPANWDGIQSVKLTASRVGAGQDCFRVVIWTADFPFTVTDGNLVLCDMELEITNTKTKEVLLETSGVVTANQKSYSSTILNFKPNDSNVLIQAYDSEELKISVKLSPGNSIKK